MLHTIYVPAQVRTSNHVLDFIQRARILYSSFDDTAMRYTIPSEQCAEFEAAFHTLVRRAELVDRNIHKMSLLLEDRLILPLIEIIETTKHQQALLDGRVASSSNQSVYILTLRTIRDYTMALTNAEILASSMISWTQSPEGAALRKVISETCQDMQASLNKWLSCCQSVGANSEIELRASSSDHILSQALLPGQVPILPNPSREEQGSEEGLAPTLECANHPPGIAPPLSPLLRPTRPEPRSTYRRLRSCSQSITSRQSSSDLQTPSPILPHPSICIVSASPPGDGEDRSSRTIPQVAPHRSSSPSISFISRPPSPPIPTFLRKRSREESQGDLFSREDLEVMSTPGPSQKRVRSEPGALQCPWAPPRVRREPVGSPKYPTLQNQHSLLPDSPSPLRRVRGLDDLMLANGDGLESDTTEDVPHFELDMDSISSDDYEMDEVMSMISLPDIEEPRTPHSVWSFGVSRSGSLWEELPRLSRWVKAVKGLFPIFGRL